LNDISLWSAENTDTSASDLDLHGQQARELVGALGADGAGKLGAHPGQVVSAIIPARRVVLSSRGVSGQVG
jgi:hypothetical protein